MPAATERMSRVDTAWLRMDSDANLMMIIGIWLLAPKLGLAELQRRAQEGLLVYPRFGQKVVEDALGANWVEDEAFDIEHHVQRESLRVPAGQTPLAALKRRVAELAGTPLDASRPLWQFRLIEDLDGEHSALICRIHHCIGDGIALTSVMLSMADGGKAPPPRRRRETHDEGDDWLADTLIKPMAELAIKAIGVTGQGLGKGIDLLSHPGDPVAGTTEAARLAYQVVSDLAAFALMPDDSPTRLKGTATPGKRVAWGEPLRAGRSQGRRQGARAPRSTTCCSAAWPAPSATTCAARATTRRGRRSAPWCRSTCARSSEAYKLGNRFGLVPLVLPIGIANPIERLVAVRARMDELKGSFQPLLAFGVLALSGLVVKPVQAVITGLFAKKATAVMTNVPGPREPLKLCGRSVDAGDVLGAAVGRHRHGRVDPDLRRRRAVRPHHRRAHVPRPRGHHRALRARVRASCCCWR